jgi:hypothetical protein
MQEFHDLTEEQALWLHRVFVSREDPAQFDSFAVPADVQDLLVRKGLVRRWRDGSMEITLGGIREVARRPLVRDDAPMAETESV